MQKAGLILILISLAIAWLLVLLRYLLKVDEEKINTTQVLRAHIDYLLMGILLIMFANLDIKAEPYIEWSAIVGAITNPFMFLVLAFYPKVSKSPFSIFGITSTLSFVVTTIGFGGLAVLGLLK